MSRLSIGNVCVALLCAAAAAQAAEPPAAPVKCATLLTAAEVQKALGAGAQNAGEETRNPGETECAWMLRKDGAFKAVSLQFYDASLIAGSSTPTAEAFYEDLLAPIENMNKVKREPLSGIGQAAAFVFAEPQMLVVVRRADGIARIVGNNLTKAQITAVAKAVATD